MSKEREKLNREIRTSQTSMCCAFRIGNLDTIKILIENGADVGMLLGATIATHGGSDGLIILRMLLEFKADPNARDPCGVTPLISALEKGYDEIVECLLDHGADPDEPHRLPPVERARLGYDEISPLRYAVRYLINGSRYGGYLLYGDERRYWYLPHKNEGRFPHENEGVRAALMLYAAGADVASDGGAIRDLKEAIRILTDERTPAGRGTTNRSAYITSPATDLEYVHRLLSTAPAPAARRAVFLRNGGRRGAWARAKDVLVQLMLSRRALAWELVRATRLAGAHALAAFLRWNPGILNVVGRRVLAYWTWWG